MDPSYEFIAPQFVDFTSMDPDGDGDEDKFFDVKNETAEEEVLGYLTARDGELTEGAMEEQEDEKEAEEEEVDIIEAMEQEQEAEEEVDIIEAMEKEQEAEEEVDIIEAREGDNMEKSGTSLQCSTLGLQSSNNSDNEEKGPSNEVKFTCAVIRMPHLTNTVG